MTQVQLVKKKRRWDKPFGRRRLRPKIIRQILSAPLFSKISPVDFPDDVPLNGVIANDMRIVRYARGDIIYHHGDYGDSLFFILDGSVRILTGPLPEPAKKKKKPRRRPTSRKALLMRWLGQSARWLGQAVLKILRGLKSLLVRRLRSGSRPPGAPKRPTKIRNVNRLIAKVPTFVSGRHDIFGELEAKTRTPRKTTVFAESKVILLEIRWPGLRELMHWSDSFRNHIEELYRVRSLWIHMMNSRLFDNVDNETLKIIASHCSFQTYGSYDWSHRYQRDISSQYGSAAIAEHEPIIIQQDHYLDDLILIHAGFARVSERFDLGEKTVGYLTEGDVFGFTEIMDSLYGRGDRKSQRSLRVIGYVEAVKIPTKVFEDLMVPVLPNKTIRKYYLRRKRSKAAASLNANDVGIDQTMLDFFVDNRLINGTQAMAINTDRCVDCDDCVRACASTHNNIPRFIRHGNASQNLVVANACMHCTDPVCLIDCPTGAIHRNANSGSVVINDETCIGCTTCASACPYNNIRMTEVKGSNGAILIDRDGAPILRATKCDLCEGQSNGPACQQACPHDALVRINLRDVKKLSDWLEIKP